MPGRHDTATSKNANANEGSSLLEAKPKAPEVTQLELFVNLVVGGLGTGIFSLPWSTAGASVLPAVLIVGVVLLVNAWTVSILVQAADLHQTFDLGSLLGKLPGRAGQCAQGFCNVGVWLSVFLVLVSYTTVVADTIDIFPSPEVGNYFHRCKLVAVATLIILPVCFLDRSRLSFTSTLAVLVSLNIFMYMSYVFWNLESESARPSICYLGFGRGSIAMMSAMMQAIIIQMCVLPMYAELKDKTPQKFDRIVGASFSSLFLIFAGFSVLGYLTFGEGVNSNVLLSFKTSSSWGRSSRWCAGLSVVAVYPIMLYSMLAPVRNYFAGCDAQRHMVAVTLLTVASVSLTATFVHDLGYLNVINGAMSLGVFVAVVPVMVGLYLLDEKGWRRKAALGTLLLCGVVASVLGLSYTDNYAKELHATCLWSSPLEML